MAKDARSMSCSGRSSAMKPQNLLDNLPCDGDLGHHRAETQCVIRWECGRQVEQQAITFKSNRRKECVQMPGKMVQIRPSTSALDRKSGNATLTSASVT